MTINLVLLPIWAFEGQARFAWHREKSHPVHVLSPCGLLMSLNGCLTVRI